MKKFRQRILEIRDGFLDARSDKMYEAIVYANAFVIATTAIAIVLSSAVFMLFKLYYVTCTISILAMVVYIFFLVYERAFEMVMPYSAKLLVHFFGRYGRVVTKKDWLKMKKAFPNVFKEMWTKDAIGHCYQYSLFIALFLEDAQLMYCSVTKDDGEKFAHSVVVKNNCVYCTNARQHFDLNEYMELCKVEVYKMFSKEEYCLSDFIDRVRDDFIKWCAENNVYCPTD